MKTSIGVIGLGIIGSVWARHYSDAGVLAGAWNRTAKPDFPSWKISPLEVARAAAIIQIVVADPPAVQGIIEQILPALGPEKIVVQSSTIDAQSSDSFKELVEGRGARYLEAPFTGSKPAAEQKKSVYYLGGEEALIAEVEPVLTLVSEFRYHIGTNAQATALKLAMNLNLAGQMQALSEALMFARKGGVTDDVFFKVIKQNVGYSGLTGLKESKLRTGDFSPQFSVKHMFKDMRLASRTSGCEAFPLLAAVRECLHHADQAGYADEDFASLIKLLK